MFEELKKELATVNNEQEENRLLVEIWLIKNSLEMNGVVAPHLGQLYEKLFTELYRRNRGNRAIPPQEVPKIGVRIGAVNFLLEHGYTKHEARKCVSDCTDITRDKLRKEIHNNKEQPPGLFLFSPAFYAKKFKNDLSAELGTQNAMDFVRAQFKPSN